ncbi:hypothetical protein [Pseudomonas sp.]|uniref:hypothetical protein n=1 Tax=Pseudomonas sp. TaxID=306 RepID=UPI0028AE391D|nr:hypothetical protein [Pseudomonas sp.]
MLSRVFKVGLLAGCLVFAGGASAFDQSDIVPALAGAAVGAVLVAVLSDSDDDHEHRRQPPRREFSYRQPPRPVMYRPQPVRYVAVPVHRQHGWDYRR